MKQGLKVHRNILTTVALLVLRTVAVAESFKNITDQSIIIEMSRELRDWNGNIADIGYGKFREYIYKILATKRM